MNSCPEAIARAILALVHLLLITRTVAADERTDREFSQVAGLIQLTKDEAGQSQHVAESESDFAADQPATSPKLNENAKAKLLDTTLPITITDNGSELKIRVGGRELATYVYRHGKVLRPFFAHVKTPKGIQVTRNFPPLPGDSADHDTMHPGLWMAFGDISGHDFWRNKARVVHEEFIEEPTAGSGIGRFTQRKSYQRGDGTVLCTEDFQCTIRVLPEGYLLVWSSEFSAPKGSEFYFGDQEEMGLGIRVATPISELKSGRILDSRGRLGAKNVWSQASDWCDYSGKAGAHHMGITILCHPENFRRSWMHARNYGLIAANAFGQQAMRKGPASRVSVKDGNPLRIRYGIFLHDEIPDLSGIHKTYVKLAD